MCRLHMAAKARADTDNIVMSGYTRRERTRAGQCQAADTYERGVCPSYHSGLNVATEKASEHLISRDTVKP